MVASLFCKLEFGSINQHTYTFECIYLYLKKNVYVEMFFEDAELPVILKTKHTIEFIICLVCYCSVSVVNEA